MLNKQIGRGTILSLFLILSLTTSVFSDTVDIQEQEEQKLNSDNLLILKKQ
ncbi:hypothetical protein [Peptostreptococcus sp. D1]|uniref:hypothetical protein n=1 Tax=Peptostreptococcus sp. D1 TaxID=72304 RepID=UPI0008EC7DC1|nr:hypothetical protein [Peptostreptococcus sp. D1]SFE76899.1 hypothetical protein SAMN02910278_01648 [Peptostreptococcus sp. D1]